MWRQLRLRNIVKEFHAEYGVTQKILNGITFNTCNNVSLLCCRSKWLREDDPP